MPHRPPPGQAEGKKEQVERMFDAIAPRYDLANRVMSAGLDQWWRSKTIAMLRDKAPARILDVATGTADLAIEAATLESAEIVGVDIAEQMLAVGRRKIARRGLADRITLRQGDAADLPFGDDRFDAALAAFGVRNFEDVERGLREMRRVLRPGGVLVVLEFSKPRVFPIKQLYDFYARHILPRVGGVISADRGAYEYLPASVAVFPDGLGFLDLLSKVGFRELHWKPLTFGIVSLYKGVKTERSAS